MLTRHRYARVASTSTGTTQGRSSHPEKQRLECFPQQTPSEIGNLQILFREKKEGKKARKMGRKGGKAKGATSV
jgi:hypothetical protein